MFENFSDGSMLCLELAAEEAQRLDQPVYSNFSLLLGILKSQDPKTSLALTAIGLDFEKATSELDLIVGLRHPNAEAVPTSELRFTERCKCSLEAAIKIAEKAGDLEIEPFHLLKGILEIETSKGASTQQSGVLMLFSSLGLNPVMCRTIIERQQLPDVPELEGTL